jgi:hypothetical protein
VKSSWLPALALRVAIYGLLVPLAFLVIVPDSFDVIAWLVARPHSHPPEPEPAAALSVAPTAAASQVAIAPLQLPPARELLAEAERILDLFDRGRMHELYASFSDEAKAQVPEDVFVAQAEEVLEQLGPRKADGWNDADRLSTLLNGRTRGRKVLLWKLHPDTLKFDVGSWRFGLLGDASEDLVLDVSGARIRLAMFSEFKAQPPAAGVWLPRTCPRSDQDPLRHCAAPDASAHQQLHINQDGRVQIANPVK